MVKYLPRFLRRWIRRLRDLPKRFQEWPVQREALGSVAARQLGWSAFAYPIGDYRDGPGPIASVVLPGLIHPFDFRHGTSDVLVIQQLFVKHEYRRLQALRDIKAIVDVGANIGAASVMLLTLFPQAKVIAIEPEPGNVAMLERNLAPYGERAVVIQAALWPTAEPLQVVRHHYRDKLDWSNQVKPADNTASTVPGITMQEILEMQKLTSIELLKIDIEGAELEVLQGNTDWLKKVKHLCIELHSDACRAALKQALVPYTFTELTTGETTYCHDLQCR